VASATSRPLYPRERDPVPIVQEAGWAPGPVWTGAENLAPTGIRSPDRPAHSESLYRLIYPGICDWSKVKNKFWLYMKTDRISSVVKLFSRLLINPVCLSSGK
jgi:hypothetical protein